jgi:hypothetical protein
MHRKKHYITGEECQNLYNDNYIGVVKILGSVVPTCLSDNYTGGHGKRTLLNT